MLIGMTSDLHIDINEAYPVMDELAKLVRETRLDVLLIAGDISENAEQTLQALEQLETSTGCTIYFVPGNHDMWDKQNGKAHVRPTDEIYETYKASKYCISEKAIELKDDWVLIGNIGWYDYSFGTGYLEEEYEAMQHGGRTWNDHMYSDWTKDNKKTQRWQMETLRRAIAPYKEKHKILMTHMVSHTAFTVPLDWSETVSWAYFNAFLGSREYTTFCEEEKIDYALMGHVHYRGEYKEGATTYVCSCLNYQKEWQSSDLTKELALSLRVITI